MTNKTELLPETRSTKLFTDAQGRSWHILQREGGSVCLYYTLEWEPVHFVNWDSLDGKSLGEVDDEMKPILARIHNLSSATQAFTRHQAPANDWIARLTALVDADVTIDIDDLCLTIHQGKYAVFTSADTPGHWQPVGGWEDKTHINYANHIDALTALLD